MITELKQVASTLSQRCVLHVNRGRYGHTYGYEITDGSGKVVAVLSKHSHKGKVSLVYTMNRIEFDNGEDFLKAYQAQLRDQEWEAAEPKKGTTI